VSFVVKNVSSAPVAYVEIHILTRMVGASEESGTGGEYGIGQAIYGVKPGTIGDGEAQAPIPPNGEVEVPLPLRLGKLTEKVREIPEVPEDISRLHVFVGTVFHEGDPDTMWYQHKRLRRKDKGSNTFVLDESAPAKPEVRDEPSPGGVPLARKGFGQRSIVNAAVKLGNGRRTCSFSVLGKTMIGFRIGRTDSEYLSVQITGRSHPGSQDYWDANWVNADIEIDAGSFHGRYSA
jgi:hypothetical protein